MLLGNVPDRGDLTTLLRDTEERYRGGRVEPGPDRRRGRRLCGREDGGRRTVEGSPTDDDPLPTKKEEGRVSDGEGLPKPRTH